MKAVLENIQGERTNVDIEISDTPIMILADLYERDSMTGKLFFENDTAVNQLKNGQVDTAKSTFNLTAHDGDYIPCDWKTALCEQAAVKQELAVLEGYGDIPVFTVSVSSIVAS